MMKKFMLCHFKFNVFKKGKNIHNTGIVDRDAELSYIKNHSPIVAKIEGRIINVEQ